jgi:hypothetical protein
VTSPASAAREVSVRIETDTEAAPESAEPTAEPVIGRPAIAGLTRRDSTITVGSADDQSEHAADAVANRVVAALRRQRALTQSAEQPDQPAEQPGQAGEQPSGLTRAAGSLDALRRQAHRSGVVGRAGGALPGPIADRLARFRGGGTPLSGTTRTAFEGALEADLGSVRLHTGRAATELNRQVGARAFTLGQDIFFADGAPDLASESGQHLLAHELAHAVAPEAGGSIRRAVVTQLLVDEGIDKVVRITNVSIVGRPPPTFSGSMGDHSTAFTVHVNAVQLALVGHPLAEAVDRMQDLVTGIGLTPGAALIADLPPRQAKMWKEAYDRLVGLHGRLHPPAEGLNLAAAVQEYVSAYLELRELVPLSTVNTGTVSKATSGKGKGEGCTALRAQSAGTPQRADDLIAEIVGLLDVRAVALACAEPDPDRLAELAPGLPAKLDATQRARLFVEQHLRSLQTAFPGALAGLAQASGLLLPPESSVPSGKDPRVIARERDELALPHAAEELLKSVLPRAWDCLLEELPILLRALKSLQAQIEAAQPVVEQSGGGGKRKREALDVGKNSKQGQEDLQKLEAREAYLRGRVNSIESTLKLDLTPPVAKGRRKILVPATAEQRKSGRGRKPKVIFDPEDSIVQEKVAKHEKAVEKEMELLDAPEEVEVPDDEDVEEAAERKGYLAIQVVVDDAGVVTEMRSAGRSPSPFSGTMGAHTTAWTVHLDRVRQLIVNQPVADALKAVTETLAEERKAMADRLGPAFSFPKHSRLPASAAGSGEHDQVISLQNAIVAHLEAVNSIPGATLPAADTGGKSEGKYRRVLLERLGLQQYKGKSVAHSTPEVLAAVVGLLDLGSLSQEVDSDDRLAELLIDQDAGPAMLLAQQHLVSIEDSYPGALAAAGLDLGKVSVARVIREALKEKKSGSNAGKAKDKQAKRRRVEGADGESVGVADPDPESSSGSDSGKVPKWDPSILGASSSGSLFDSELGLSGSLLGMLGGSFAPHGGQGEGIGADWLDDAGNLRDEQLPRFVAAYRADVNRPGVYLAQAEGPLIAADYGFTVNVYRDRVPGGFTRVENIAGGDCLIHAFFDIRAAMELERTGTGRAAIPAALGPAAGRAAGGAEINRLRGVISVGMPELAVANSVRDIVLTEVDGRGTPGLGPQVRGLLRSPNLLYKAAVVRGRRRRAEAEKSLLAKQKEKSEESPKKTPDVPPPVVDAPVLPQETYGNGVPSLNYALLHTGGNHYVALIRTG